MIQKIGRGFYCDAFEGINTENNEKVAIKVLRPVSDIRLKR